MSIDRDEWNEWKGRATSRPPHPSTMSIDRDEWNEWKARIRAAVDELRDELLATSHAIHANPELAFHEVRASARLADELERGGLTVERGVGGIPTAFRATLDGGEPGPASFFACSG